MNRRPGLEVDRRCDVPVENREQVPVRDAEAIEEEFPPIEMTIEIGKPLTASLQGLGPRRLGERLVEERHEQGLVQLGADEREPLLQSGSLRTVARREPS